MGQVPVSMVSHDLEILPLNVTCMVLRCVFYCMRD